ncbi:MAG: ketopantoate reductase family protein [Candidatus Thorarchaeota archaeon]
MKAVVYGAGAIGSILGATLHRAGHDVVLVARQNHVDMIREHGLKVKGLEDFTIRINATTDSSCVDGADVVFLTVKTQDTTLAVEEFSPHLGKSTPVVSLQNGIRNPTLISEVIGTMRVIPGVVRFTASYLEPGEIEYTRKGNCIIGELDGTETERIKRLCDYMSSGIPTDISTNIESDLWAKLVLNLMNLPLALTGSGFPKSLKNKHLRQILVATWDEGRNVVKKSGIEPNYRVLDQLMTVLSNDASFEPWMKQERDSLDFISSTYQSLLRGSSSEEEFLTGEIVSLGEIYGLATPVNSLLMQKLQNMIHSGNIELISPETLWNSIDNVKSSV